MLTSLIALFFGTMIYAPLGGVFLYFWFNSYEETLIETKKILDSSPKEKLATQDAKRERIETELARKSFERVIKRN